MSRISQLLLFSILLIASMVYAQENKNRGIPPAPVVVAEVNSGRIVEEDVFVGTVYYQEVSEVASEVRGAVEDVRFEEAQRLKKGNILVELNSELLEKSIESARSSYEQSLAELERAAIELRRAEDLYRDKFISEQVYDENRFKVKALEKKVASLKAEVEVLEVELKKKFIRAPFDGLVIAKHVDRGEWLEQGKPVATLARDDVVDVIVNVPEEVMRSVILSREVKVISAGHELSGKVHAIVPRGDVSTRTFPIKIRVKNSSSLMEGMEARVKLPRGAEKPALIVPRDAILTQFGNDIVYIVNDGEAKMITVQVVGYQGLLAGVKSDKLREGMKVVIKGNERLREGQMVNILSDGR